MEGCEMMFTPGNVMPKTSVYDAETGQQLKQVSFVNTDANEIGCFDQPLRIVGEQVAMYTVRYEAIHAIYGGYPVPCLFICYGRID
jgi:hypothetical protein